MSDDNPYPDTPELFDEEGDSMAFGIGLGHGFTRVDPRPSKHKSTDANPYYYYPGYILGYLAKVAALVALAHYGLGAV
jgi:hypothetical protein